MFTSSLRRCAPCPVVAFAALLLMPPFAVSAQPTKTAEAGRKSLVITVDYVETTLPTLAKSSLKIAAGPQHDAQFLAALIKNGATDTKSPRFQCTDGGAQEWIELGKNFDSLTTVKPHFNADGTVTVALAVSLSPPFHFEAPFFNTSADVIFRDGQTCAVGKTASTGDNGKPACIVFARVVVANGTPPPFYSPLNPSASVPRSVDPGMVATPPVTGDEGMVAGRGMDPKSIDRMNVLVLPAPPAPKRK